MSNGAAAAHDTHHNPNLAHHFESLDQQTEASILGMWVFLVTEVLFFGGALMAYLVYALKNGPIAGNNPWGAVGLEWNTTSPPPTENFTVTPVVTWEAYEHTTPLEGHVV